MSTTSETKKRRLEDIQDEDDEKKSMEGIKKQKIIHDKEETKDTEDSDSFSLDTVKQLFSLDTHTLPNRYSVYQHFRKICHAMICDLVLVFNPPANSATKPKLYQFVEFEFYCMDAHHRDVFAHCDDLQFATNASWYFHRSGNASAQGYDFLTTTARSKSKEWVNPRSSNIAFRGGSFKGLDITFGAERKLFGGILIRSIRELKPCMFSDGVLRPGEVTQGPSKCVDKILHETGYKDIKALTSSPQFNLSIFGDDNDDGSSCTMYVDIASKYGIQPMSSTHHKHSEWFYCSPRVGLTLKAEKSLKGNALKEFQELKQEYLLAPYRCIRGCCLSQLKKYKALIALSLLCTNYYQRKLEGKPYEINIEYANKVGPIKNKKLNALVKQYQDISAQKSDQKQKIIDDQSKSWKSTVDALAQTFAALYS